MQIIVDNFLALSMPSVKPVTTKTFFLINSLIYLLEGKNII